jgi:Mg-chelatase subunit ChlD
MNKRSMCFVVGWLLAMVLVFPGMIAAEGLSSTIEGLTALDFPQIVLRVRVFSPELIPPTRESFELHEQSTRIATFAVEALKPQQYVVLVLDRSSSMENIMGQVKTSANSFLELVTPKMKTCLLSFASDMDLGTEFTNDVAGLKKEVAKLRPWGGTALYDALYKACELVQSTGGRNDVRTVVCLTDGKDESPRGEPNFSAKKPKDVADFAVRHQIRIITIGLGTNLDEGFLTKIARFTHGWYLHAPTVQQLSSVFQEINAKIMMEQRFRFSYQTPNPKPDGTKREVTVTSLSKGKKDQGKGEYTAPLTLPKPETTASSGNGPGKKRTESTERDWGFDLSGPDGPYLTGPILPGPYGPVHGPNAASFLGLSEAEAAALVTQAEKEIRRDHAANLQRQIGRLDEMILHIDGMLKRSEAEFAASSQADYEKGRLEYRKGIIAHRRYQVDLHRQECLELAKIALDADLQDLALEQKRHFFPDQVPESAFDTIREDARKRSADVEKTFDVAHKKAAVAEDTFEASMEKPRNSHVINERDVETTTVKEEPEDLGTPGKSDPENDSDPGPSDVPEEPDAPETPDPNVIPDVPEPPEPDDSNEE